MFKNRDCGRIRKEDIAKEVILNGWVMSRRDHGGVIFVDLRDRSGIVQIVFDPSFSKKPYEMAHNLRSEYVIGIKGIVKERDKDKINPNIPTGEVEVFVSELVIFSKADTLPFELDEYAKVSEEVRLRYRFLDLRRADMQKNLIIRNNIAFSVREFFQKEGFVDIETPFLTRSTPEGARDFLVPSRLNPGKFYALPQSPQLFKQILMASGFEKYYQIVKCFRDEDLRADRQPEFTQIDLEMSFVDVDDVLDVIERMLAYVFKKNMDIELPIPFPRMSYDEAIKRYGSDKPDTRFGLEIIDVVDIVKGSDFKVFENVIASGGSIACINAKGGAKLSRKDIDELTKYISHFGAKGLAWMKVEGNKLSSSITKFFSNDTLDALKDKMHAEDGDILFFVADKEEITYTSLGALRIKLADVLGVEKKEGYHFLWVVDFPLFEYDAKEGRIAPAHHPFTYPHKDDIEKLENSPLEVRAKSYDLVLNGVELGSGSIRIHDSELQKKVFKVIGIDNSEAEKRFGFLLNAFRYGVPPHGGFALGFDRFVMILAGAKSLREVIAFPKTQRAQSLLSGAPSEVDIQQLMELKIKVHDYGQN